MKRRADEHNIELAHVLDTLAASDVDITVREVARQHPSLRNASAFTRDKERMKLIADSQARQKKLRTTLNPHVVRAQSLSEKLDKKSNDVVELEAQVRALVASHAACINAVMVSGGMAALQRYWQEYREIGNKLRSASAYPDAASVVKLRPK